MIRTSAFKWVGLLVVLLLGWEGWETFHALKRWDPDSATLPAAAAQPIKPTPRGSSFPTSSSSSSVTSPLAQIQELSLPDLNARFQSLSQWQGLVRIINFWASWCEPCRREIPTLVSVQRQMAADGVRMIGIGIDQPETLRAFLRKQAVNYPILVGTDDNLALTSQLGNPVQGLPFTLILDEEGKLIFSKLGQLQRKELVSVLEHHRTRSKSKNTWP